MKIITFQGGLGNQMFIETYYRWLRKHFSTNSFWGYYPHMALNRHNGLEISRWFDVNLPPSCFFTRFFACCLFFINKLMRRINLTPLLTTDDSFKSKYTLFYEGYFQNKEYMEEVGTPSFRKDLMLSDENKKVLELLKLPNAVAVHVRRGDYTDSSVNYIYGGICTLDYYIKAIDKANKLIQNPHFFFFSDDKDYVKKHFDVEHMAVVDFNSGENSFFDMYLMAHASNLILANSTFSWWAAALNKRVTNVFCPNRWINIDPKPNLIRKDWVIIE